MPTTVQDVSTRSPNTGVSRVGEVEVGYDPQFEEKWWKFEKSMWVVFTVFIAVSISGWIGRGIMTTKQVSTPDHSLTVEYERVEHFRTPAKVKIAIQPAAVRNNHAQIWIGGALLKQSPVQGIDPAPLEQVPSKGGALLIFAAPNGSAGDVMLALQPSSVGSFSSEVAVPGGEAVHFSTVILP